jgi:CheY-like chemotaxis protein
VTVERSETDAVVAIKDNGIGIPPDQLKSIFDMFNQVDRSIERSKGGLGIGLALVKRLVQMHGGSVEARSAGENQGSEFVVRLPISKADSSIPAGDRSPAQPSTQAHRILVVDDNRDAANSLATLLQITGHETFTAYDGTTALAMIEQRRPDVVLLDIGLPRLNGYEVCRRVRALPWGDSLTLIALTGWGQEDDRRKSHDAGFDGHLVKPVEFPALMSLLDSLTAEKQER